MNGLKKNILKKSRCVIFGAAKIQNYEQIKKNLLPDDFFVFCDGGLAHSKELKIEPDLIVGDFDSFEKPDTNSETIVLPCEKDDTDSFFAVKEAFGGYEADFAFQCTGSPVAHANIYKFIRSGGGLCELGFFINGGDATINPHFDICAKEITTVGSWVYTLRDYATTFDFLKRAKGIGLPLEKLITHKFPLSQINEAHITNLKMEGLKIAIVNE